MYRGDIVCLDVTWIKFSTMFTALGRCIPNKITRFFVIPVTSRLTIFPVPFIIGLNCHRHQRCRGHRGPDPPMFDLQRSINVLDPRNNSHAIMRLRCIIFVNMCCRKQVYSSTFNRCPGNGFLRCLPATGGG